MLLPEVTTLTPLAKERVNAGVPRMIPTLIPSRRAALAATIRFVRIPLVCAALVAVTSPELAGRLIALAVGVVVVSAGVTMHARELFGRVAAR